MTIAGMLKALDRAEWETRVASAMRAAEGRVAPAAAALGVSRRQLLRWLSELPDVPRRPPGPVPKRRDDDVPNT